MRPDVSVPQAGSGQREGLLWPCLPRSRILRRDGEGCLSLPIALFELASSCRYQHLPEPVGQIAGALAPDRVLGGLPDQRVMLGKESNPHRR